ncbi:MAG TPA: PAS domain S-box protein [Kofleriaceae bacterium]|nr:PAS domain S-box protein [Kofleriaceae bacterium]
MEIEVERNRLVEHVRMLVDISYELAAATDDSRRVLELAARRLTELVGDCCAIRTVTEDGEWLEAGGAACHRDPQLHDALEAVMLSGRQRIGTGMSGRVATTRLPHVIARIDPAEFAAASEPRYHPLLERLAVVSSITLPLVCRGELVGVVNLLRGAPGEPYDSGEVDLATSVAEHVALAIGNARLVASERRARELAEQAVASRLAAEARFARLSDCGIIGTLVCDADGRVHEINDALLDMIGYTRDEIMAMNWRELTPPDWSHVDNLAAGELVRSGVGGLREKQYVHKSGGRVTVLVGSALLEGYSTRSVSFVLDLTGRRAAEVAAKQLREERMFRALLESAPDAMVITDEAGAIAIVNTRGEEIFGYSRDELAGKPLELVLPDEERGLRRDGTELVIEQTTSPLDYDGKRWVSRSIRDVTERRRAEAQRGRLAAIVDASDDAIIGKSLEGIITSWNPGAARLFGYTAEEIVGESISKLIPVLANSEEREVLAAVARGEVVRFEAMRCHKSGRELAVAVTTSPVRDANGRVIGASKVARDITEKRQSEYALARAKESAETSARELEAFSYSVAHDLRAPLRGMNGFAQMLLDDYGGKLDEEARDWLNEIANNARKMGALIDALLSLSRVTRSELRRESIDLSHLVRAAAVHIAGSSERVAEWEIQDGIRADVDPSLARSLVDNLIGNAWKFTSKVAVARIAFGEIERDGAREFFVRDNGAGFDMAYANKLFAPFQRLHTMREFEGTGIGLATVQRIVRRHGGRITAEGAVGAGATFSFSLPAERA